MRSTNPLRQKMISMMYLVLIAMFILNLPLEVLDAFTDLDRTLVNANNKLDQRNIQTIRSIESFKNIDSVQYGDVYNRVLRAKALADSAIVYLDDLKTALITRGGGRDPITGHLRSAGNAEIPTNMLYRERNGKRLAKELYGILTTTKNGLMEVLGDSRNAMMLDTVLRLDSLMYKSQNTIKYEWDKYYFDNVPLNAVVALLSKFQNDVRIAEYLVINYFSDQIEYGSGGQGGIYNFQFIAHDTTKLDTVFLAKGVKKHDVFSVGEDGVTTLTLPVNKRGDSDKATIYVYDDKGNVVDSVKFVNGMGEVTLKTDQIGEFTLKGVVKFRYPDDSKMTADINSTQNQNNQKKEENYPFEVKYKVVDNKPFISQREYKTLYIGINNPLNIFHPEYQTKDYRVSISQGKVIKVENNFYAMVNREGFANVSLEVPDGKNGYKKVAEEIFKIRELPKPSVSLYNKYGGTLPAKIFKQQKGLNADAKELPVDVNYRVTEFSVTYINANGLGIFKETVKGSYFTGKSKELIDLAQPGDIFIFDNISVKGPDGINKTVDALVFNIL